MSIPSKPPVLRNVIGYDADVFSLPDKTVDGSGALSYESGWPRITGISLKAGGKAPQREYFNQVNKLLSQHLFFLQSGNVYDWDASLNYNAGAHVLGSDGLEYVAVSPSGPDVPGVGAKDPAGSRNKSQWLLLAALLMSSDGGMVVDPVTGKGSVDFEQMPTDKFEALLKSIRVPIWLTKPLTVYVATTGSDTLDDGRGLTEDKPFATLQAALNYVSDTYNLSRYNVTVRLAEGDYGRKTVSLPSYTASTGEIYIQGADANDKEKTKIGRVNLNYSHTYHLVDLTCKPEGSNVTTSGVAPSAGFVYLQNVVVDISETVMSGNANIIGLSSTLTGTIYINATAEGVPNGVVLKVSEACPPSVLLNTSGGQIIAYADIKVIGSTTLSTFALARQLGKIQFLKSASPNPGRNPVVTVADGGQVTGTRYVASLNGIIDTSGQGAEFFPGTTAGRTENGGQYN